jgi:hypothetical protein
MGFYIVDTNIIISYMRNEDPPLVNFINNNKCFYTNTVHDELFNEQIPKVFKYVDSEIKPERIVSALKDIQKTLGLTEKGLKNFHNDLSIILEAGYICYDITEPNDYNGARLLTHNLKLFKKFIKAPIRREKLEKEIDLHGFEHLIDIVRPEDVIPYYSEAQQVNDEIDECFVM